MQTKDGASVGRTASIVRSHRSAATSRNQSLIRKQIAPNDAHPSDILVERFQGWKIIVKQLVAYFEGIADIEGTIAREYTKLGAVIQVPFRAGNQFLGEGGIQDIYYSVRDKTRAIADQHANLSKTIDSSIVQHLQKLRTEIKAHVKNIQDDTGKLSATVAKERELSARMVADLAKNIAVFKNTPMSITSKDDPFIANVNVARQLQKQVHEENALQKSIIIMQQNSAHFEEGIVRAIQSAWQTFDEWQSRMDNSVQDVWRGLSIQMAALAPDREWISFSSRSDHLIDPDTPLRNPDAIQYPSKEDPSVIPVHMGHLERKKRFTRTYKEAYYVLTPAGYLHEYASSDPKAKPSPVFSLFLPACTLGPPSSPHGKEKSHKFHIEGRKDGTGTIHGSLRLPGKSQHAYTFRARSHEDMMEWWNDIRMLCARYLVASESIERSGPIHAAVRAAGYESESEDEEGSSVEEEQDEEDNDNENELYLPARDGTEVDSDEEAVPPSYSQQHRLPGEYNANGYAVEKKHDPNAAGAHGNANGGANVSRRHSKRQHEKAPEGQSPHVPVDDGAAVGTADMSNGAGPAPVESRFTESL